jgi:two-component system nitrate/nitrite sensor histidine kinase NarX/two-component system sensor histidine kinase UhpB
MQELRRRAEQNLQRSVPPQDHDAMKHVHELQVHQIELEMQNLELQRIRAEVEDSLARYTALYDLAPIGYFSLDRDGAMTQLNLTGARLLQQTRASLLGRQLADFVAIDSRQRFIDFLQGIFSARHPQTLELELTPPAQPPLHALIEATADESGRSCRAMVVDITARRDAERRADELLRQNRALAQRMFSVQEAERRELARELHDEVGQWLTAIQAHTEAIRSRAAAAADRRLLRSAVSISDSAGELHRVIRQMLRRLRPSLLDALGLAESLRELTARWRESHPQIHCDLELQGDLSAVSDSLAITAFRIVQEALTNVAKHAQARRVAVRLQCEAPAGTLVLSVEDDGRGLRPSVDPQSDRLPAALGGLGVLGMRERVIAASGEFSLHSAPGQGVRILARLPLV